MYSETYSDQIKVSYSFQILYQFFLQYEYSKFVIFCPFSASRTLIVPRVGEFHFTRWRSQDIAFWTFGTTKQKASQNWPIWPRTVTDWSGDIMFAFGGNTKHTRTHYFSICFPIPWMYFLFTPWFLLIRFHKSINLFADLCSSIKLCMCWERHLWLSDQSFASMYFYSYCTFMVCRKHL